MLGSICGELCHYSVSIRTVCTYELDILFYLVYLTFQRNGIKHDTLCVSFHKTTEPNLAQDREL